ncbi:unnamed protein product [Spodoptera littoralis]|uniref:Uncharacterized protein n=1 Tax=Spodoptera littoralis TaxID=7109 RepID=A0A9P0I2W4_SPOLI|nr:unnamed protein product [Spodoptera littoralis]CAH1638461.1 unnamed protein product [Spodoptera littoralis]
MLVAHLALLHAVACLDIQVEGDLAFDLRVPSMHSGRQKWFRVDWEGGGRPPAQELLLKMQAQENVTVAPEVECIYQYPEKDQVDALLSNMMNELTKVFVKANKFINGVETRRSKTRKTDRRRHGLNDSDLMYVYMEKALKKELKAEKTRKKEINPEVKKDVSDAVPRRREVDSRFKVVNKKEKAFFEVIYSNMTDEYRQFYNRTAERVARAGRDPCRHQREARELWRALLQHAERTLRDAARRTLHEYLRDQRVQPRARVRAHLAQFLAKELAKVRANQLEMLCDKYQLCFNDLLE